MDSERTQLGKSYDPAPIEDKWYSQWVENGLFKADASSPRPAFSIVIPPPNVTGSLHVGHALDNTLQDILSRTKRMQGYEVLWLPGTDHAGIATQNVVERSLAKEGISRHDLGREEFVKKVWEWKELYGSTIINQLKKLGASCDWSRERFTMDEGLSRAVRKIFVQLYKKGLIYRGKYLINWCPRCQTALSDLEVEHEDEDGKFYEVAYKFADGSDGAVVVMTTRPETILGDSAIAIHPRDEKNRHLIGKKVIVPLVGRVIPVIEDNMVDPEFGSGCVKITPAHDPNDFLVGQRHNLEQIQVIDGRGIMNENAGKYAGMDRFEARDAVAADLEKEGALLSVKDLRHSVGHCYRCHTVVEPYLSEQWFVRTRTLADAGVASVQAGKIKFIPEQWTNVYYQWMENIRDWCISRQLWWGHRIPAWYCDECGEVIVEENAPDKCPKCGCTHLHQDEDVLDTWFSSGLWPFSTMGWPDDTETLRKFYPTSVLVTGFDIIFFWVARMIMFGLEAKHEVPFRDVYITRSSATRRDRDEQVARQRHRPAHDSQGLRRGRAAPHARGAHGAGARHIPLDRENFDLSPLHEQALEREPLRAHEPRRRGGRSEDRRERASAPGQMDTQPHLAGLPRNDAAARRILLRRGGAPHVRLHVERALRLVHRACEPALRGEEGEARRKTVQAVMLAVFEDVLKLMHPIIPFVTEELWHAFPFGTDFIMRSGWPKPRLAEIDEKVIADMNFVQETIRAVRNLRAEARIAPQQTIPGVTLAVHDAAKLALLKECEKQLKLLTKVEAVTFAGEGDGKPEKSLASVLDGAQIYLPVGDLLDVEKEMQRLRNDLAKLEKDIEKSKAKLANEKFVERAPAEVIEKEKNTLADTKRRPRE